VPGHPKLARFSFDADFVLLGHTHQPVWPYGSQLRLMRYNPQHGYFNLLTCAVLDLQTDEAEILHFPDPRRVR
jgi:predicted phosphodiesterase